MELHLGNFIVCPARFVFQNQTWPQPHVNQQKCRQEPEENFTCGMYASPTLENDHNHKFTQAWMCRAQMIIFFEHPSYFFPPCFGCNTSPMSVLDLLKEKTENDLNIQTGIDKILRVASHLHWKKLDESVVQFFIHNFRLKFIQKFPSWQLTYPLLRHFWRWLSFSQGWDMLVP